MEFPLRGLSENVGKQHLEACRSLMVVVFVVQGLLPRPVEQTLPSPFPHQNRQVQQEQAAKMRDRLDCHHVNEMLASPYLSPGGVPLEASADVLVALERIPRSPD